jgi:hypothetical protein
MRLTATPAALLALAVLASTPGVLLANPIAVEMAIDFDPPGYVHAILPAPYTVVNAYVIADFTGWVDGINAIAFRLGVTPEMGFGTTFTTFNPIIFITGDWETGIVVWTDDCLDTFPVVLGYLSVFYLGPPGYVTIEPHPELGTEFTSCEDPGETLEFCYVQDGAIGTYAPEPRFICQTPVLNASWGAIKTLYR